ncbi:putative metal-dependent phosphoesterase TrpH [Hymenobacter sp. UYAg731]
MAFNPENPATQQQLRDLTELLERVEEKLDLVFFAQAEWLVKEQRKNEPAEEQHTPTDEVNSLANLVNVKQDEIREGWSVAQQWLSQARRSQ